LVVVIPYSYVLYAFVPFLHKLEYGVGIDEPWLDVELKFR